MMSGRVTFADLLKKAEAKEQAEKPHLEIVPTNTDVEPTPPTPPTPLTLPTPLTKATPPTQQPISPERDFAKVANSIVRDAVSQGLFIGKSKQIYDFLYLQTRGAVSPKRSVRITKLNLMRGSGIGSERTLLKNLNHLKLIGLIKIIEFEGQHGGNEYETFLPEETHPTPPTPLTPPHPRHSPQKVVWVPPAESGVGGVGLVTENKEVTDVLRLNTKTLKNDDEAFSVFSEKLNKAAIRLNGRKLSKRDADKLGDLADLLILQLDAAARKTSDISSVPAFLTEVLRRKLFNVESSKPPKTKVKVDNVGKGEPESYEIKPLDEKGREDALDQLREFAADDFLEDFKRWYTENDWLWLIKEMGIND